MNTPGHRRTRHVITGLLLAATTQGLLPGTAAADPAAHDWHRLRDCESGNNYTINTGNGYYGAYQFTLTTWHSIGGTGLPNLNPPAEQDYRALYLYRMRGWQPWGCHTKLHLHDDADARSERIPTRDEAQHIADPPS